MRAIYLEDITSNSYEITGEQFHHLVNVVRLKVKQEILLLDGKGSSKKAVATDISKKMIKLESSEDLLFKENKGSNLVIGVPKKDALDLCLKQAVELGVKKIYLLQCEYAQKLTLNDDRLFRILVSALEQSNNSWLPEIIYCESVSKLLTIPNLNGVYFSSQKKSRTNKALGKDLTLIIGPEGGFSLEEEELLKKHCLESIHFEGAIMRTPTALSFAVGYIEGTQR